PWPLFGRPRRRKAPLRGRARERAVLSSLLDRVRQGGCHMALIEGESGIGKTALAEALAAEAEEAGCFVLRGACREPESIPYNAFDTVVDEAAAAVERLQARRHIARESLAEWTEELALAARLFPVVRELVPGTPPATQDRKAAFAACKRLVERAT